MTDAMNYSVHGKRHGMEGKDVPLCVCGFSAIQ
jgi:hypothetical protein